MPIIIFEGADGSGKSTAVDVMCDHLFITLGITATRFHRGPPKIDPLVEYTADLESFTRDKDTWAVCDRWHWGELIYGPIYRGTSLLEGCGHEAIDWFLARRNAIILLMDPGIDKVLERVDVRGDDYVERKHLPFIVEEYRRIRLMKSPVTRVTIKGDFTPKTAQEVINAAKLLKENS